MSILGLYSYDDPPASWYGPLDEIEAEDVVADPAEDLAIVAGVVCWHASPALD